ncbi:sigma-70 family RNA polymerase sigma factor [Rhizobium sp. RAF56]|uniref:sigma-70 family RNA polymerase sigma factor n=1 Tax=Rhizobium sp. RAF56 TaxID=3233062 RepID=UPI003F982520
MTGIRILSPVFFDTRPWIAAVRGLLARAFAGDVLFAPGKRAVPLDGAIILLATRAEARQAGVDTATRQALAEEAARRFHRTIVPHLDASYNFARFLSRDADAAQDIVQEAFLRAYRHFDGYRGGDPRAWLFSIVRNCYRAWRQDFRRKAHFEQPMPEDAAGEDAQGAPREIASDEDTPEMAMLHKTDAERVRAVIRDLPEAMREILVLRELEELSYRQIAEITGAPIGTVMSRLARARQAFAEAWRLIDPDEAMP